MNYKCILQYKAANYLLDRIAEHSKPVNDSKAIAQVGAISAGNDQEVGQMIAVAMEKVGKEGVISLEEGKSMTTELEVTEGMRLIKVTSLPTSPPTPSGWKLI